jgi:hypothetical protein
VPIHPLLTVVQPVVAHKPALSNWTIASREDSVAAQTDTERCPR